MTIPKRNEVPLKDTWDLSPLFADDAAWERSLDELREKTSGIIHYKGRLGESLSVFKEFMAYYRSLLELEDLLGEYAGLRFATDQGDDAAKSLSMRFERAGAEVEKSLAWFSPELLAMDKAQIDSYLGDEGSRDYRIYLEKMLRYREHTLSEKEEALLAAFSETSGIYQNAFAMLTSVDMKWGTIKTAEGDKPLSQASWGTFMENPDRKIREEAYTKFYANFEAHSNTLAALYAGSVKNDVVSAHSRGFKTAREQALFPDKVGESVYDNLVATVNKNLPTLHRYYALRKRVMGLDKLRHYDVYVSLFPEVSTRTSFDEAVSLICKALAPLGETYVETLRKGLLEERWCDRYENQGKTSGAFSSGAYSGPPYLLMSYKEDSISSAFTLAHEAGHSLHTWHSRKNNPFLQSRYSIFEAEVASTFNEELLFRHLLETSTDQALKTSIIAMRLQEILGTLFRQTMFAEYEALAHSAEEAGIPLTLHYLRSEYRKLLEKYFGPDMVFEENSDLEGLRIPHFYGAFYVYKYSTGISAALALAKRVLSGGEKEKNDYFNFLKSGASRYPLEALEVAGLDMASPQPIQAACDYFAELLDKLEQAL